MSRPSISVVVAAYNAEAHIAETLTSVLEQTSAPEEIVVVDDGSTDATREIVVRFGDAVRLVSQPNSGGAGGGYNRGFAEARGDYIARCDADDVWMPAKLARQRASLAAHPEIDIAVGAAWMFGREERLFAPAAGDGVLDPTKFAALMFDWNILCSSTALIRRRFAAGLGLFDAGLVAEDYDFWMRALAAGATYFYDPEVLVRYRLHESNITNNALRMARATELVHRKCAEVPGDARLVRRVLARDLRTIGRLLVDDDPSAARRTFLASLRQSRTAEAAAWAALLSAPPRWRQRLIDRSLMLKRGVVARLEAAR